MSESGGRVATLKCTISGSFRRFFDHVNAVMHECVEQGIEVLSPRSSEVVGETNGFVLLRGDPGEPREIEAAHLRAIARSDFLYVVNPGGYIGPSATMEIGYAIGLAVPVFCLEAPSEPILSMFVRSEASIEKVKPVLGDPAVEIPRRADLRTLQAYIRTMVRVRGFDDESLRDVVLLLVEEIGELAKAVRRQIGLKVEPVGPEHRKTIGHELADCLIYLLDIANLAHVDLDAAFRSKEEINHGKIWTNQKPSE